MNFNNKETNTSLIEARDWSEEINRIRNNSFGGNYNDNEILMALELEDKIIRGARKMFKICFEVIEDLYVFIDERHYKTLGHTNFKNWILSWGGAASTFNRYLSMYRIFTCKYGIPRSEYEQVDVTKLHAMMPLAKYAKNVEDIKQLIIDADEMRLSDCHDFVKEEIEKIEGIKVALTKPSDSGLEPDHTISIDDIGLDVGGVYRLVKLTDEEEKVQDLENRPKLSSSAFETLRIYCFDDEPSILEIVR